MTEISIFKLRTDTVTATATGTGEVLEVGFNYRSTTGGVGWPWFYEVVGLVGAKASGFAKGVSEPIFNRDPEIPLLFS